MAYRFRVYAPTGTELTLVVIQQLELLSDTVISESVFYPQGVGTPMVDINVPEDNRMRIYVGFNQGSMIPTYRFIVNVDNADEPWPVEDEFFEYFPYGGETNVQIRVEVSESSTYGFATLVFNANGGSLGSITSPVDLSGDADSYAGSPPILIRMYQIPSDKPTRKGYTFDAWTFYMPSLDRTMRYNPGDTVLVNLSSFPPGPEVTLTASWIENATGGVVRIGNGTDLKTKATPHVWDGTKFRPATPYVWNGGWKKGI